MVALLRDASGAPERYLSANNLRVVLAQTVIVALGAIGMTLVIVGGGIDLVGRLDDRAHQRDRARSDSATAGRRRSPSWPPCCWAALVGLVNGLAITRLRVVPFIATLGMLGVARGAAKWLGEPADREPARHLGQRARGHVPVPCHGWCSRPASGSRSCSRRRWRSCCGSTVFGRRVFALGSNEAAARACGIATDRLKLGIYSLAGLFFGLAGVMQMSRLRQGDPTVAIGTELDVIAAVVIGGGSLSGGEGSILGSMVGALIMAFLRNGSQQMGWPNYVQEIIIGVIIVVAVAIDRWRHAQREDVE